MRVKLLVVGTPKNRHLRALADDYTQRLTHYTGIDIVYIKEDRHPHSGSAGVAARCEQRLMQRLTAEDYVVVLDDSGQMVSSPELARFLAARISAGTRNIVFVIGGPTGLPTRVKEKASLLLSLSPMTFPHELCLVLLLEQLYRAFTILRGEPYHK